MAIIPVISEIIDLISSHHWIMVSVFLAFVVLGSMEFDVLGVKTSVGKDLIEPIILFIASPFGIAFEWRYFVILVFLMVIVGIAFYTRH